MVNIDHNTYLALFVAAYSYLALPFSKDCSSAFSRVILISNLNNIYNQRTERIKSATMKTWAQVAKDPPPVIEEVPTTFSEWDGIPTLPNQPEPLNIGQMTRLFVSVTNNKLIYQDQPILVSVDTGRNQNGEVTEIGIASLDHASFTVKGMTSWSAAGLDSGFIVKHYRIIEPASDPHLGRDRSDRPLWQGPYSEFCQTTWIHRDDVNDELTRHFASLMWSHRNHLVFIGHDLTHDAQDLMSVGYDINSQFKFTADTQQLSRQALKARPLNSLDNMAASFDIKIQAKHNGANDAVYTLGLLIGLVFHCGRKWIIKGRPALHVTHPKSTSSGQTVRHRPESNWYEDMGTHIETIRNIDHLPTSSSVVPGSPELCNTCGSANHDHLSCDIFCFDCGEPGHNTHSDEHLSMQELLEKGRDMGYNYVSGLLAPPGNREDFDKEVSSFIEEEDKRHPEAMMLAYQNRHPNDDTFWDPDY